MSIANSYTLSSYLDNQAKGTSDWSVSQLLKKIIITCKWLDTVFLIQIPYLGSLVKM